ncbi:hypothetical protein ACET3X_001700 [Alternaria dauci]|uniref:Uncharacterized protein n=1 Tax=Alternaria dauci TaxID=48095 RepID=A0ABR3UZ45_9PLEO
MVTDKGSEQRYIKARFNAYRLYVVPWAACCSWHAMKALLIEWHREDEDTLRDISNGDFTIMAVTKGCIHPQTWEQVIEHGSEIRIWTHSAYEGQKISKEYESSVQYVVNIRKYDSDGNEYLTATNTYKEPVEFELTDDSGRLPALQEIKDIVSPNYQDGGTTGDSSDGKKTKLGPHDRVTDTSLRIISPYLLNILKSVTTYTEAAAEELLNDLVTGMFYYPYRELYHHLPALLEYQNGTVALRAKHSTFFNERYDEHLNVLQKYLNSQPGVPIEEFKERLERKIPTITFATYWLLLKPGSEVYVREDDGSLNAYILDSFEGGVSERGGKKTNRNYKILVWNLMYGETKISPNYRTVEINVFDNAREIASLSLFPSRFLDEYDKEKRLEKRLVDRGKRYFTYSKSPAFLQYTGRGLGTVSKTVKPLSSGLT